MPDKSVSVIVTMRNEARTVQSLLEALLAQTHLPSEVVIVDAASDDGTVGIIQRFSQAHPDFSITVESFACNRSRGRNRAITLAAHDVVAITDAGCVPTSEWLAELLKSYNAGATDAMDPVVAGYAVAQPETDFQRAVAPYLLVMPDKVNPQTYLPATRSMLITKANWQKVGGFDESLNTSEDFIFAQRLKAAGVPIIFAANAVVRWTPPSSLKSVIKTFVSFSAADVRGKVLRPKVVALYGRYLLAILGVFWLASVANVITFMSTIIVALICYLWWAVRKNQRYVGEAWYLLPILQLVADASVMLGTGWGAIQLIRDQRAK